MKEGAPRADGRSEPSQYLEFSSVQRRLDALAKVKDPNRSQVKREIGGKVERLAQERGIGSLAIEVDGL